jgi:hypothetical protein
MARHCAATVASARPVPRNGALGYHKPIDLLRAGEFRRVLGAIDALAEGVFV